jgi:hypothetical protein
VPSDRLFGLLALVGALWARVRALVALVTRPFIATTRLLDSGSMTLPEAVRIFLDARGRRIGSGRRSYVMTTMHVAPLGRAAKIVSENVAEPATFYLYRGRPVWLGALERTPPGSKAADYVVISYVRGTLDIERLLLDAADHADALENANDKAHQKRFGVMHFWGSSGAGAADAEAPSESAGGFGYFTFGARPLRWAREDLGVTSRGGVSALVPSPAQRRVAAEVAEWMGAREWYKSRGIPWRFGVLLEGPPGSGKTAIARAVAEEYDLPVKILNLAQMTNQQLHNAWSACRKGAPCMVVIEDVDRIFDGDKCVSRDDGKLTFDALLNVIDGLEQADGILLVITTNHGEKIDPALARPGRIDSRIEIGSLDFAARLALAKRIVCGGDGEGSDQERALAAQVADESGDVPAAHFIKLCRVAALDLRAGRRGASTAGGPYR